MTRIEVPSETFVVEIGKDGLNIVETGKRSAFNLMIKSGDLNREGKIFFVSG